MELYRLIDLLLSLAETVVEISHQLLYLPHERVDDTVVCVFEGLENCSTLKDLVRTYEYLLHLYGVSVRVRECVCVCACTARVCKGGG